MFRSLNYTFFIVFMLFCLGAEAQSNLIWYEKPAFNWNEALPIGNGRLAAMVFGGVSQEVLQLNEETVWAGEPGNNVTSNGFREALPEIRKLIFEGKYKEAQDAAFRVVPPKTSNSNNGMPYQPVGNLLIAFPGHEQYTSYRRELDISKAISSTTYKVNGTTFRRETFVSFTDQLIIVRLTADKPGSISCSLTMNSPQKIHEVAVVNSELVLKGVSGNADSKTGKVSFQARMHPVVKGGQVTSADSTVRIEQANEAIIYVSMATNFVNYHDLSGDEEARALKYLDQPERKSFDKLRAAHIEHYRRYFDRVVLDLGSSGANRSTDVMLKEFKNKPDPALVSLYFQFGRYLLISSSQPGSQTANLQGKWNDKVNPPWGSKYTININTEMNYWPSEVTNLSEMGEPLFAMLKDLEVSGKESARTMYNARGWNAHHNTDLWRITGPVDGAFYGLWPMGGAWLSQHLWQHYLYTGDKEFLKENYYILKGAALFLSDVLQHEPTHNWLVVVPSMSPENAHMTDVSIAGGTTMDTQLTNDVFSNFIAASAILSLDRELSDSIQAKQRELMPMHIGKWGQLQEWLQDWDKSDDHHRHVSHLYGLYPSNQISPYRNAALFAAARTSLEHRGDRSTGWSMGWKVNLWARLLDGDRAYSLIRDQLTYAGDGAEQGGGTYLNLLDAHPPFQIDGNFGCTSGIAEMLMQSHDGAVHLLPALPVDWKNGKITGLRARGGFTLDITWKAGKLSEVKIKSALGGVCRLRTYEVVNDKLLKAASGRNPNEFFATPAGNDPVVADGVSPTATTTRTVYEYDLATKPGQEYVIKMK
ncbi:glycoside hydrolase family 95 protein [Chryseolinea sp. T2]|uniref:glycoside hydrolase family 95 protein n=1 Tax=Chryseolinea sp. T2 TaxID=3129255 RepID=UPI0030779566